MQEKDTELAAKAIKLNQLGAIEILIPNNMLNSTLKNIIFITNGFHYNNKGRNIVYGYIIIIIASIAAIFFLSPLSWYLNFILAVVIYYIFNSMQKQSLKKCIHSVALSSSSGFLLAWQTKLIALKIVGNDRIFINGHDELESIINLVVNENE